MQDLESSFSEDPDQEPDPLLEDEDEDDQIVEQFDSIMIGDLLINAGIITIQDAEDIMFMQQTRGLRFGEAALTLGLVTEEDIQKVLSKQFNFPYITENENNSYQKLIAANQPFGKQADALRAIRSQLMMEWFDNKRKSLAVISPARNAGNSYMCANLAIVFSQLGVKTLLIDANLRHPIQHELFNIKKKLGLSDLLGGRQVNGSIIFKPTLFNDLSIFPAGTIVPNPVELIAQGFKSCLLHLHQQFDVILIDSPAAEQGVEAKIIAEHSGAAILIAKQDETQLKDLETLKVAIESYGSKCLGAIISDFESKPK